jgi:NAD(P)H-dependent FMN reductase
MSTNRPIFIPVILGTTRQGRASERVARLVADELGKWIGVETKLIDIRDIKLRVD